jgi:hypothetical protein
MLNFFSKRHNRVEVQGSKIFIDNQRNNVGKEFKQELVFSLETSTPEIIVYENDTIVRSFRIEPLLSNKDLAGQFLHSSIRVLSSSAVMIDGIISRSAKTCSKWTEADYEGVRFQPFFLSDKNDNNVRLIGKGLFERGLHFSGVVTPSGIRSICICDNCRLSFTLQHFHAGFSEIQYFYSTNSKETLLIPYKSIENLPVQLQQGIDSSELEILESKLPRPSSNDGVFRYYNSFKCPSCLTPFIDFEKYKEIRTQEYYGNVYINEKPRHWKDNDLVT